MRTLIFLMALVVAFSAGWAFAEEEDTELEEVVVTAERSPTSLIDTARAVEIVTQKDIFDAISRTVPESLRRVAGVAVQRTTQGGGSPFIRGLIGNQVLYLVDGVRMNNSTYRGGPNQYLNTIDPFFVEQIEVVRGPGSVLYGSDALGGVIQVITKRRADFANSFGIDGRAMQRATTAERESTTHLDFNSNVGSHFGMAFSGNFRQFGDIDPGGTAPLQAPYGYEEQNFAGNADWRINPHTIWEFSAQHVNLDEVPNYDPDNPKNVFEPQRRNLYYTRFRITDVTPGLEGINLFASFHRQIEGRQKISADDLAHETRDLDVVDTLGAGLQFESAIGSWIRFIYGGEYYHDAISSKREVRDIATGVAETAEKSQFADDSTYTTAAGYLELRVTPTEWFRIVPGVRYSYFAPDAEFTDADLGDVTIDDTFSDVTWAAHILFQPHDAHGIILGVARGFRAPSMEELSKLGSEDGRLDTPNPDIEPEKMIQYELGYRISYPRISGSTFAFYSDITDLIGREPTSYQGQTEIDGNLVHHNTNIGEAYIYGIEAQFDAILVRRWLEAGAAGAYQIGQNETDDEPIRRVPPLTASAWLRLMWEDQRSWFEVSGDFAAKQERLAAGDISDSRIGPNGTGGFGVMNLRSGYAVVDFFEIQLAVDNVFDERYKYHGSGPYEAGRNFKSQLSFLF